MEDYKLELDEHEGFSIISITGQADQDIIDELDTSITKLCEESHQNIVIDLLELGYLFSKTISSFVKYYKILKDKNLQMVLINASPTVREILEVSKLTRIIPVFNTITDFLEWSTSSASKKKESAIFSIQTCGNIEVITFKVASEDLGFVHIGTALNQASIKLKSRKVILDLSRISSLNSVSVAALIELGKSIQKRDGVLVLSGVNALTQELLRILNISNVFHMTQDIDEGITFLNEEEN